MYIFFGARPLASHPLSSRTIPCHCMQLEKKILVMEKMIREQKEQHTELVDKLNDTEKKVQSPQHACWC